MAAAAPAPDLETRLPFTRAAALAAGFSPKQLRGPRFRRIFCGVYISAAVPDHPVIRVRAALLLHPDHAVASHYSAARVLRLPVPPHALEHVSVADPSERTRVRGIRCHVGHHGRADVRVVDGIRVSGPCVLFLELAAVLTLVDLVVVGDALVGRKLATPEELVAFCAAARGPHVLAARRAASFVRRRVDSPMETRLRMLLVLAGLPEPEVNLPVHDAAGRPLFKFDLSYPAHRLIVEYDGRQHAEDDQQWLGDIRRREWLDDEDWKILVVTSKGIFVDPAGTVARVERNLRRRGCRDLPARLSSEWRAHFPGR